MKAMPYQLKQKLRSYGKAVEKSKQLHTEIEEELEKYGVPYGNLTGEPVDGAPWTEALSFITYAEGNIEDSIQDIEEVFVHFANKGEGNEG